MITSDFLFFGKLLSFCKEYFENKHSVNYFLFFYWKKSQETKKKFQKSPQLHTL